MKKTLFESKRLAKLAGINESTLSKPWAWQQSTDNNETSEADEKSAVLSIAKALAKRAMEMLDRAADSAEGTLDLDGDKNNIDVNIDVNVDPELYKLFLSPYIDFDGHKGEVPALADHIYTSYVSDKSGDQAHSLEDIIDRIDIDYFDEDLQYALEALGDDRFTMPSTWDNDDDDSSDDSDEDPWAEARAEQELSDLAKWRPGDR